MANYHDSNKSDPGLHTGSTGERVLAHAQAGREVVQDFVPLADSMN